MCEVYNFKYNFIKEVKLHSLIYWYNSLIAIAMVKYDFLIIS